MPPPTVRTRPEPAAAAAFAAFLETTLDSAAAAKPNPGRAPVHRLNRAEYSNAIRDLLAVDVKPGAWLPVDDSGYGFDNIAAVLSTSPALLERYMTAARRISRLAIGDITLKPVEDIYDAKRDPVKGTRNERISDYLPFDSRAGISIQHYFPVDGEYVFKVRIPGPPVGENDPGDRPVPSAHSGQGRTPLGRRDVAARKSEGRERRASGWPRRWRGRPRRRRAAGAVSGRSQAEWRAGQAIRRTRRHARRQATGYRRTVRDDRPRDDRKPLEDFHLRSEDRKRRTGLRQDDSDGADAPRVPASGQRADMQPLLAFYEKGRACRPARRSFSEGGCRSEGGRFRRGHSAALSKRCSSLPTSCSASNRIRRNTRPARRTRSPTSSWPRACRSSSGAAFPTISCSTWPSAAG